ncbi:Galactose-binding domain-like, Armadillo-type fold protein [Melia azedarach]|uniref:Galactose-binding domain-like, Armadillo-type fold protein n=1 Tax=Melia azedarach TaxID=155640 RepID=A0ACC1YD67_MELAZ|nr:Galactose-binding domain-like, Armadillo-type fold protein [Melia azedarach]
MEIELEPRVKPLPYKVKGMSRESPSQKAAHVLDTDLRTHWSTGTNTKEWILLELDEPCLLSHIRIYNKSVLEWEIAVGLKYKPETFVKVRPRCEAPRRDVIYPMNYTPCRYVRISCLRGNPIAVFFIQLIGVTVTGLESEFQPVVNHLLPHIMSHKQDAQDMHLQLLQDMTNRLHVFLPQLEVDLSSFSDAAESNLRFLAMLSGLFYPILHVVKERETARSSNNISDSEASKSSQPSSALTVSSNFEPRRSRGMSPFISSTSGSIAFRQDAIFLLLRKAYKDSDLGTICRKASRVLQKLVDPVIIQEVSMPSSEGPSDLDETSKSEVSNPVPIVDYSNLFGEEFRLPDDLWDFSILNVLDIGAVEEGILHVLYACASQPLLCSKLAESSSDFWSALPLVQALLPALRPSLSSASDHVDDSFSQWKQPFVQQALSQIVVTSSSSLYQPLLHACAGYLSSFSPSHAKAACILLDLCSGLLAPWMAQVVAKVDLIVELVEDLLGTIQGACHSPSRARAALKYVVLALSGHMDDLLGKYKEVKHKILFLLEMLEPFLDPAIFVLKSTIEVGNISFTFTEKQKHACDIALNVIRTAVQKSAVLPSLESEWRLGSVAPSVLLSILEPHMQLPPEIDLCKSSMSTTFEQESSSKSNIHDVADGKTDTQDGAVKNEVHEDAGLFFAPPELRGIGLTNFSLRSQGNMFNENNNDSISDQKQVFDKIITNNFQSGLVLDAGFAAEYVNLQADYFQLVNFRDCELRASEFRRLASDLHSQHELSTEGHDAAIDALLLAAECYVNPFFVISFRTSTNVLDQMKISGAKVPTNFELSELRRISGKKNGDLETVAELEKKRDKIVLQLLLEAAELDKKYQERFSDMEHCPNYSEESDEQVIKLSPHDTQSADAVTLVRQNQALLCNFLIQRLQREQHSMQEILTHCLVFFLHSATKLYCAPELVIDIILGSAGYLNGMLSSFYCQLKEGNMQLSAEKIHGARRRWILLQRLVIASSGGHDVSDFAVNINKGLRHRNLIPPAVWMQKISTFSSCASALVRFLGWMAISRIAEQFIKERLFLVSDISQLTYLLSIFADELALVDNVIDRKREDMKIEQSGVKRAPMDKRSEFSDQKHGDQSFHVIYPDLYRFFPNMKKQFELFGETILEAVGLQLRSLPSSVVPDILCWFSDLCMWPFVQKDQSFVQNSSDYLKGFVARNAKAVILYVLEAIVIEHMEAMVPEIPRVVQVLVSLCMAPYCDVPFLESILHLLKPIISYSLRKAYDEEKVLADESCLTFESLCFDELLMNIRQKKENQDTCVEKVYSRALTVFILASIFPDLSFPRKKEMLESLILWADFTGFEPTTSFHDYLGAFQSLMENCKGLLVQTLRVFGFIPLQLPQFTDMSTGTLCDNSSGLHSVFLSDALYSSSPNEVSEKLESNNFHVIANQKNYCLSADEVEAFSKDLEALIAKLFPTIEFCWNLHHQLAKKLTVISAQCFMYSRCLSSMAPTVQDVEEDDSENPFPLKSADQFPVHWNTGLKGLAEIIMISLENHCWEVASVMLDCLLQVPHCFQLDYIIDTICSVIKIFSCSAPKIAWRLQIDKWLSLLFARGIQRHKECEIPLVDLFCTMLGHPEPEQRFIALQHLGKFVGQDIKEEPRKCYAAICNKMVSSNLDSSIPELIVSFLVSSTWDRVVVLASSDASLPIRTRAMALLVDYIPFADQKQLQSFLVAADTVLHGFGKLAHPVCEGPLLQLSLALIAGACLYSPVEDISLIPQNVWKDIETLGSSKAESRLGNVERKACQVLCRLRAGGDEAKEILKEVFSSNFSKSIDPEFGTTRESILQVLANLTSVQSYFDLFSDKMDQEAMELEEAEMELDIIQKEYATRESLKHSVDGHQISTQAGFVKDDNRLQQIKDSILSLEKSKLREEIVARRQKKLLLRRARQKYLEEAALQEAELLQELDRERTAEMEKEIERQRLLELERAKSRELRHNLDMEKERQTQRELQRELEQAESGLRSSSRRDFSSAHSSRTRERYRERENGRSSAEGTGRTGSGSLQPDISSSSSSMGAMPTIVLSGNRSFSGQTPTILQSRDRSDDCGSSYEENFEGSKDSGDTGSIGDPESVSAFEGQSGGFGSGQRHGSRGSKSRQVMERRERDGRREGKWERKH